MPYRMNYPSTVCEVLDRNMTFKPVALRAVRRFARSKPWRGTVTERVRKFRRLNHELATAYGIPVPRLRIEHVDGSLSGQSCYVRAGHCIIMRGKLSVVTFLHEFGHARGFDERQACRFSINLFRRCFPRSFANCVATGHVLTRRPR